MISDEQALALGKEMAELMLTGTELESVGDESFMSLGRIAVKLAEPIVLEGLREPTEAMIQGSYAAMGYDGDFTNRRWQAMIDARLGEIKGD